MFLTGYFEEEFAHVRLWYMKLLLRIERVFRKTFVCQTLMMNQMGHLLRACQMINYQDWNMVSLINPLDAFPIVQK